MKNQLALLTAATVAFVALTGFHGGCGSRSPEDRAKRIDRMSESVVDDVLDDVDASDDQRQRAQQIRARIVNEAKAIVLQHPETRAELWAQWESKQPDAARVHALVDDRVDALRGLLHKIADGVLELHALLTPEQRAELTSEWKRH